MTTEPDTTNHLLRDYPGQADHPHLAMYGVEPPSPERTLPEILSATMSSHPTAVAVEGSDGSLTYAQLREVLDSEANRLAALGVGPGGRVGIRVPSGTTDLYVAILATIWSGAAYVPVDWDEADSRAETVWEEAEVDAVYGAGLSLTPFHASETPTPRQAPGPDDDAWIIFTSGTTGKPKGVAIRHRSAAAWVDAESRVFLVKEPLGPGDRVMAGLSVAFDASCEEMWLAWRNGATLVAASRDVVRSGDALADWLIDNHITVVSTVPTLAAFWPAEALENVRLLIFGGEACPLSLIARLARPGREIWNTYGPTETTVIVSAELMTDRPPVRIGRPIPGWELVVVDETGEPVPWGDTGELIVGGIGLGRYLDPVKDAEAYAPLPSMGWDRAYRTGDIVRAEQEGLVFIGRADDQIKFAGRRLELGELDDTLTRATGVRTGAAALQKTPAGSDVLVAYLVSADGQPLDLRELRSELARTLPGGITPILHQLDEMPMKTSGKVDRKALPWPLPDTSDDADALPGHLTWLADLWRDQLGPVPLTPDSDFFDLGGSSVAIARLVTDLRRSHPSTDIAQLYDNRTLEEMAAYVTALGSNVTERPLPARLPWYTGLFQTLVILLLYVVNGLKYAVGSLIVVWFLSTLLDAAWVLHPPGWPLLAAWLLLFSLPGRMVQATIGVRVLTAGLRPGTYRRGGPTHLRVWAADRLLTFLNLDHLTGTPTMALMYRLLGNKVGRRSHLGALPPVSGLLTVGDDVSVEPEVDLAGHWIDGDRFIVGNIRLGDGVRVGTRSLVSPGAVVEDGSEILPGSHVEGTVPAGQLWGGSPLVHWGDAGQTWPAEAADDHRPLNTLEVRLLHWLGLAWVSVLPILAVLPGALLVYQVIRNENQFADIYPVLLVWAPVFVLLTIAVWLLLVVGSVRVLARFIPPGYYSTHSVPAWAVWLTQLLMERTLISTYFIYASGFTPTFLRLLGARVGEDTEISTIVTIPHLTCIQDRSFVADHALAAMPRHRQGWVHVGSSVIGTGSFVGNSAIVGADRDLPPDSLVAVLSTTPYHPEQGTTWLGRTPVTIPRKRLESDDSRTFRPPGHLKAARGVVEFFRLAPAVIAAWLDITVIYVLSEIFLHGVRADGPAHGLLLAALWSGPVVLCAGLVASTIPVLAKWLLVGRFRDTEKALFSAFVWRSELADNISEPLAVPSLIRMSLGTPWFNLWARAMGTRIGRHVWVESWWLPEFDLITLADRSTVNRGTVLQTHLFHDRVMSLERVTLDAGATLGPNSFLLPGARLESCSTVGPSSLVLRGDTIPGHTVWGGNPVRMLTDDPATLPALDHKDR